MRKINISQRNALITAVLAATDNDTVVARDVLLGVAEDVGQKYPAWWINDRANKTPIRGVYKIPELAGTETANAQAAKKAERKAAMTKVHAPKEEPRGPQHVYSDEDVDVIIPEKYDAYVPFGAYEDLKQVLKFKIFYPAFITGLSGNGKTEMVQQICAELQREMVRVNITEQTDEDDLLGGIRLKNGATTWHDGPIVVAMKRGAVVLLDEVDLASHKIMCLQPVLEGKGVYLKKINQWVKPAPGFNVIATANTKGQGSLDGKFMGTQVLNEAFLERFSITFEQDYPLPKVEEKILQARYEHNTGSKPTAVVNQFISVLADWADQTRKSYASGAITDVLSTRRLIHIIGAFSIFNSKDKAIDYCLNRFDPETQVSFRDLYKLITPPPIVDPEAKKRNAEAKAKATTAAAIAQKAKTQSQATNQSPTAPGAAAVGVSGRAATIAEMERQLREKLNAQRSN